MHKKVGFIFTKLLPKTRYEMPQLTILASYTDGAVQVVLVVRFEVRTETVIDFERMDDVIRPAGIGFTKQQHGRRHVAAAIQQDFPGRLWRVLLGRDLGAARLGWKSGFLLTSDAARRLFVPRVFVCAGRVQLGSRRCNFMNLPGIGV